MLRKSFFVALTAGGLLFSGAVLAITTDVTVVSHGDPIPGQQIDLIQHSGTKEIHHTFNLPKDSKIPHHIISRLRKTDTVDIKRVQTGETVTGLTVSQLTGGGQIDIGGFIPYTPPANTPQTPWTPDTPNAPPPLYIGIGGGGYWTNNDDVTTTMLRSLGIVDKVSADDTRTLSSGVRGSIYGGYNLIIGSRWLAGFEVDVGLSDHNKTARGIPGTAGSIVTVAASLNDRINLKQTWDFGLRARVAYAITPSLTIFGTGGVAFADADLSITCSAAGACGTNGLPAFTASHSTTLTGFSLGGGIEATVAKNWIARVEYRYTDYGTYTATYGNPAAIAPTIALDLRTSILMVGLAYQFGGGGIQ